MKTLLAQIKQCRLCEKNLPLEPKPILQIHKRSKILILGQAPGAKTHQAGIPFEDQSGDRLRTWLGVEKYQFYHDQLFAILPMSFCYPGRGKSGDLPPLPQCALTWHKTLLAKMTKVELTIILGKHAIAWYLQKKIPISTLAQQWQTRLASNHIVLPHPSPRNNPWLKQNPWFEADVIPKLQQKIQQIIT